MKEQMHPIRVAAARSGLTPDVLRAWEKRYEAVAPQRMDGRRLYSEVDIERLVLLRRATLAGRRIGDIASLSTDDLRALDEEDRQAMAEAPARQPSGRTRGLEPATADPEEFKKACMAAVLAFDSGRLEHCLSQALVVLGKAKTLDEVVIPFIQSVGEMWRQGTVRVAQEHLATAVLQTYLSEMRASEVADSTAPRIVVTTLPGQYHELGALVVAATAASEGWNVSYLGPNLPTEEIAAAVLRLEARAVALSLIYPADDPRLGEQIEKLRKQIADDVVMIVGGSAAASYTSSIKASGATHLREMASLRALLSTLRMAPRS